jgi:hypothetical protein
MNWVKENREKTNQDRKNVGTKESRALPFNEPFAQAFGEDQEYARVS